MHAYINMVSEFCFHLQGAAPLPAHIVAKLATAAAVMLQSLGGPSLHIEQPPHVALSIGDTLRGGISSLLQDLLTVAPMLLLPLLPVAESIDTMGGLCKVLAAGAQQDHQPQPPNAALPSESEPFASLAQACQVTRALSADVHSRCGVDGI